MISFQRLLSVDMSLKKLLRIMHLCGLLSLPGHYKHSWKTQLHRFYTAINLTLTGLFLLSISLGLFLNTINELGLFCERFFVFGVIAMSFSSGCFLNAKLSKFIGILGSFDVIAERHREKPVVLAMKNLEEYFLLVPFCTSSACLIFEMLIFPFLQKSNEELDTLAKLYNLKYPHNTLPFPLYIPYVDPSEPTIFYVLFALFLYMGLLQLVGIVFNITVFPICVFHLKTGFIILKDYTKLVGKTHYNSLGQPVFYTHLLDNGGVVLRVNKHVNQQMIDKNNKVSNDCQENRWFSDVQAPRLACLGISMSTGTRHHNLPGVYVPLDGILLSHTYCLNKTQQTQINIPGGNIRRHRSLCYDKYIRRLFKYNPTLYESFYLVQLMVFHNTLMQQRHLMDEYFQNMFKPLTCIVIGMLIVCMYASFMPVLPGIVRLKLIIMASGVLSYIFIVFYCGELLASCNESLSTALWLSRWYTCSQSTVRNMILFLRMNQKLNYFLIMREWNLSYSWMIGVVRFAYSVFNVMRFRKQRG